MSTDQPNRPTTTPEWGGRTSPDARGNTHWWPNTLSLGILHQGHPRSNPFGAEFDYAEAFEGLDVEAMTRDLDAIMTDSQEWWPADWGHYGPFFIRMAWHAAGTYRITDGRGGGGTGAQRYAPLNSWPDNGNLDKARRLLLPIKQTYGKHLSWADLFLYTGNRALETMGFRTFGFGFGRADIWAPEDDIYWGPEAEWLATEDERYTGSFETEDRLLDNPLAAVQMGLIYVNPEGPNGVPDALKSAMDIRETFDRMAMNDRETVALTVGGHTFGKMHGAGPDSHHGEAPEGGAIHQQGLGWTSDFETGLGAYTITSGLEGAWTPTPIEWDNSYLDTLMGHEWELVKSPAGANQWEPKSVREGFMVPDAHVEGRENKPVMSTADMAMITDPAYLEICQEFQANPDVLADEFARAWFKLTHRDMGPIDRYLGPLVPDEELIWQDPVPAVDHELVGSSHVEDLTERILDSGLSIAQLVSTAWASASTFRRTDFKGGANGARIRLEPMAGWDVNVRSGVAEVVSRLDEVREAFNAGQADGVRISLADMVVLAGTVAVEQAARAAGHDLALRFTPGRTDATQDMTDVDATGHLEPRADGFRNYVQKGGGMPTEHLLVDKAFMLGLSAPEMAALVAGLRVLGANADDDGVGVLTDRPGQLTNDFFVNLLDMGTVWEPVGEVDEAGEAETFRGVDRSSGEQRWTASRVDLVFGSNAQLRAISEEYAAATGMPDFLAAFASGWDRVMTNDRFDVR